MNNLFLRIIAGILMEVVLAVVGAPIWMQAFPVGLFLWAVIDLALHIKIVKVQVPTDLPKELQEKLKEEILKQVQNDKGIVNKKEEGDKNDN